MRLLHYPSQEPAPTSPSGPYDDDEAIEEEDEKVIGIGAHTEYVILFELNGPYLCSFKSVTR
jgi:hypothetical protein